jgi:hypothetical protein
VALMHTLVFSNADDKPRNVTIRCDLPSVAPIMAWYAERSKANG